jgi:phosphoribosylanthranilate isomerase
VAKVGVFVDHSAREIQDAVESLQPAYIQLHGHELPEFIADLPTPTKIIRAYRCGPNGLAPLASYLERCDSCGRMPDAVLLDSDAAGAFGGTGRAADWSLIADQRAMLGDVPLILAGGLKPGNIGEAIAAIRPDAVDVASGVERQPRAKDRELMKRFVAAARQAFD